MLSIRKSASDRTGLGYDFSTFNIASTSATIFVPLSNNDEIENNNVKINLASENLDKGKSILGAPPKLEKKNAKYPKAKKATSQKPKQKKQHLCHHCGIVGHARPNCSKWLATQQSNGMIASRSQNQLQSSLAPLEIFSKLSCSFQTWIVLILPSHRRFKGLIKGMVLLVYGRNRAPSDSITFLFLSSCFYMCITCVFCFQILSQSSFYALFCLTCFCLVIFQFFFVLFLI